MIKQNEAEVESVLKVQDSQTNAFATLKEKLALSNEVLIKYIKAKLLKNYNGNNMALNLQSIEALPSK